MSSRSSQTAAKKMLVAMTALTVLFAAACTFNKPDDDDVSFRVRSSDPSKRNGKDTSVQTTLMPDETLDPTGSYAPVTTEPVTDLGSVRELYLNSYWYDAVEDNPMTDYTVSSDKAFALKAAFYFTKPIKGTFEVKLYKDSEVILTHEVSVEENVTVEADFSAGIAGLGTFEIGTYYVELVYEGTVIADSPELTVN